MDGYMDERGAGDQASLVLRKRGCHFRINHEVQAVTYQTERLE